MPDAAAVEVTYLTAANDEVSTALPDVDARRVLDGLPVRDFPVYQGRRNYSGYFWSATNGGHVVYESLLELSWLWVADFDQDVTRVAAQPMHWRGRDGDRVRVRIPDFMCRLRDDTVRVVDVKPKDMLSRSEVQESLAWSREVCLARGWDYEIWSGPDPTLLRNIQWIAAARHPHVLDLLDVARTASATAGGMNFADLTEYLRLAGRATPRLEILGALWVGAIRCDLTAALSPASWIEPCDA